jgi:hypothetical protein
MKTTPHTIAALHERLRQDIIALGTRATSRLSGIPVNQVHRFRHGQGVVLWPILDRMTRALGYSVTATRTANSPITGRTVRRQNNAQAKTSVRQRPRAQTKRPRRAAA